MLTKPILELFEKSFSQHLNADTKKQFFNESYMEKSPSVKESTEPHAILPEGAFREKLRIEIGKHGECFSVDIGPHPDFKHLANGGEEYHYICSLFMDISGSTRLSFKMPLKQVKEVKQALLSLAIEVFQAFDGHVHRLQGDAIFAFFGHKKMKKSTAITNAINAASLMQHFNEVILKPYFEQQGISPLRIRVGMDIGEDDQVLWSRYGIKGTSEITTTSIHTDLAAKLQHKSKRNGIMLGENVYRYMDFPESMLKVKTVTVNQQSEDHQYILINPNYQMRQFDWKVYLNSFPKFTGPQDVELHCYTYTDDEPELVPYYSNENALNKEMHLRFELKTEIKPNKIKWIVQNNGSEATGKDELGPFHVNMEDEDSFECISKTAYNGFHTMTCILLDERTREIARCTFGVTIHDNISGLRRITFSEEELA